MTMMTEDSPARGATDRILDPMSRVSLSRSASGDSFVLEEKKSGDTSDIMIQMLSSNIKKAMQTGTGGQEYRHVISSEPGSKFLPESGRYQLYVSRACPNSHLALMVRNLKGLGGVISMNYVQPHPRDHLERNWMINSSNSSSTMMTTMADNSSNNNSFASLKSDASHEFTSIREIYQKEGDNSSNTIPLLYDTTLQTIVNNDATDICSMLNSCFDDFTLGKTKINLSSSKDNKAQLEIQRWLYPLLSLTPSPVPPYLYTFCPQQLNVALNRATHILEEQRYLTDCETITQADLRLFATLIRYDQVYATYLSQPPRVMQNPALLDYCRDIYQHPGIAETVGMDEIRVHFLGENAGKNGGKALLDALKMPHQRHLV